MTIIATFLAIAVVLGANSVSPAEVWPMPDWERADPADLGLHQPGLERARDYALTGGGSGLIVRGGRLVLSWGDPRQRYDLKSSTKAIGVTALGLAIQDGKMAPADRARKYLAGLGVPPADNAMTGWLDEITIQHLATQTAGFEKPGGFGRLLFRPGTAWHYSDGGPNWLADCLTIAYRRDLDALLFERVFTPLGITRQDLTWRENAYRPLEIEGIPRREIGSGISADVDAMARIGLLYLRGGRWRGQQLIPPDFVDTVRRTVPGIVGLPEPQPGEQGNASDHYGLLWWNNADGTLPGIPRDAYWAWGLYDSLIVVIPSLDVVIARAGRSWARTQGAGHCDVLRPFLTPIVAAVRTAAVGAGAPYPPSRTILGIDWAAAASIVRRAGGSDNWPMTWGDDDALYTAYGDGRGFEPFAPRKLSLGLAKVIGTPDRFTGVNIPSPTGEQLGDGSAGKKASGLLMVEGVLYLWARNAGNAQLAWSVDRGATWTWSPWLLTTSFGCPTFLNFDKDYAGARDGFVYVYSHDGDSAYEAADRMVLARVPKDRIRDRTAYEFFAGRGGDDRPAWTKDLYRRAGVFSSPGRCWRSSISYSPALKRYLWVQILPGHDPRLQGGLGIYEAPEPWGPWTTVYFAADWDVGPGETAGFPTKWMSADGCTLHLVGSGNDGFSVRRATLVVREPGPDGAEAERAPPTAEELLNLPQPAAPARSRDGRQRRG
jgi:CubicO group peptidase (beta-lactamase class C family)